MSIEANSPSDPRPQPVVQQLTATGTGALAMIRVVGPGAVDVVARFFRPGKNDWPKPSSYGRLVYGDWVDTGRGHNPRPQPISDQTILRERNDEVVDDVIVCAVRPDGTEVEISCHGGLQVTRRILRGLVRAGATISVAGPSDVWRSGTLWDAAVLRGLDAARTPRAVRLVLRQWNAGAEAVRAALRRWIMDPRRGRNELRSLCQAGRQAQRLIDGAIVAIVGPPNAGKSTLFNRMVGRTAALTSPCPGTTRDWIESEIDLEGVAIRLIDLAGFRETNDPLERRAIAAAQARLTSADLCLVVVDGSSPTAEDGLRRVFSDILHATAARSPESPSRWLAVFNKSDLMRDESRTIAQPAASGDLPSVERVLVSALTGEGMDTLRHRCLRLMGLADFDDHAPCVFDAVARGRLERFLDETSSSADGPDGTNNTLNERPERAEVIHALLRELFGPSPAGTATEADA